MANGHAHPLYSILPDEVTGYAFDPFGSWWTSIVPEQSRNLLINPSFERWDAGDLTDEYQFGGFTDLCDFVEFPAVGVTQGRRCAKLGIASVSANIQYRGANLTGGVLVTPGPYTWSLDIYATRANTRIILVIDNGVATTYATKTITIESVGWYRYELSYNELLSGSRYLRMTVSNLGSQNTTVYTDAWQFEAKPYATTYLDGDMVGYFDLHPNQSFYWEGAAHASVSVRRRSTGAGGRPIAWSENEINFLTTSIVGLEMDAIEHFLQVLADGSEIHRGSRLNAPRDFTITGRIYGEDYAVISRSKRELTKLLRPNNTRDGSQQTLRHQHTNARGVPTGIPLEIACVYSGGMASAITNFHQQALAIQFHASQPFLSEVIDSAFELSVSKLLYNNGIIFRDEDGDYINLSTATFNAFVRAVGFDVQGRPLAVGPFTTIGASAIEDIAYWDGTAWQQLGNNVPDGNLALDGGWKFGFPTIVGITGNISELDPDTNLWGDLDVLGVNGPIQVVVRDVSGDIYAGGTFDDDGAELGNGLNFANILKYDYVAGIFEPLGGGLTHATLTARVSTILIHDGYVYVGGLFDTGEPTDLIGPSVAANNIVRWSIAEEAWNNMSTGFDGAVNKLVLGEDGFIYAIGDFQQDGGDDFDLRGIARWNGTSWEEPFILAHADGSYGAAGAEVDERGIMWFFDDTSTANLRFDVSSTIGLSETFGWKNGVFYPSFVIGSEGLQALAIGPGDRVIFSHLNFAVPAVPAVMVPALNEIEYLGDADTPMIVHLSGEMLPIHILNLDTDGGVYFLPTLTVGANEEMVIRPETQNSIMYSESRPNLYRYMSAGPSSTRLLRLRPGLNRISVFADDETGSAAWLIWRNRYWGIEAAV